MPINRTLARGGSSRGHQISHGEATTTVRHDNRIITDAKIVGAFLAQGGAPARVINAYSSRISSLRLGSPYARDSVSYQR